MLRAVYYDEAAEATGTVIDSIQFASRVIGPLGAPVDASLFDEANELEDEVSVYADDPLLAGLVMMADGPAAPDNDKVAFQDISSSSASPVEAEGV